MLFIKSPYAHWISCNAETAALCWMRAIDPKNYVST